MALGHLTAALVSRRHPRVLLVDDATLSDGSLRRLLAAVRPRWVFANVTGGASALCEMRDRPPDIVVTELTLGEEMHGFDLLKSIAQTYPATVRVVYSDHIDDLMDDPQLDLAHVVLRKPASTELLVEALELSLTLSQELQQHDAGMSISCH